MKILSYGDNPKTSTGYGQVWDNLLSRWAKLKPDWEFYHVGWQSRDRPHKTAEGYFMLPMGTVEYGFDTVPTYLTQYNPDFLVTLADVGWQSGFADGVNKARIAGWKGKWIAYTPLDNDDWAMTWDEVFQVPDINVAMSEFGQKHMKLHNVKNITCIPHGVCTKTYFPKQGMKEKYLIKDKFVAGFVGRNQTRKMLDRLFIGFAEFAKDKPDVILLLHTDLEPPQQGWSLRYMQWKYKIENKLKLTKDNMDINARQRITPDSMNDIYNMMDVFCYPTGGEGFGLPAIECQAAGIPLLMTSCTTAYELCLDELQIPVLKDIYNRNVELIGTNGVHFEYPDDKKITEILNKMYLEWKNGSLEKRKKEAREFSLKYEWDLLAPKWIELMEQQYEAT